MSPRKMNPRCRSRRGAIVVLAAILMVVMFGVIAFALDLGYIALVRTQLQTAADASALAAAGTMTGNTAEMKAAGQSIASLNTASGRPVQLSANDIEPGTWDTTTRTFAPSSGLSNAVRVTVRTSQNTGGETPLFFARVFNMNSIAQSASAIATTNPRDICFVVDLSGSMNNDTEPGNTQNLNNQYAGQGYGSIGSELLNKLYSDLGFVATYPNEPIHYIGYSVGTNPSSNLMTQLTGTSSSAPLRQASIPVQYRINKTDSSSVRTTKAYSYLMDVELLRADNMPNAIPRPDSTNAASYDYWRRYLAANEKQVGYRSYVQMMMDSGRAKNTALNSYTPLSLASNITPMHTETVGGVSFRFPPSEQPTHAARRALIAAIQVIQSRNQGISNSNQQDRVSIVSFDRLSGGDLVLQQALTADYAAAMQKCTQFQACDDYASCTATEAGLSLASSHLKPVSQGGMGRTATNKIVVLLTDGVPNLYQSTTTQINTYRSQNPSSNFYGGSGYYSQDAALMQASKMQGNHWYLYPVGVGLGTDYGFMDRMARMGTTANSSGEGPRGSGNPADYEARLTQIFQNIITNPKLRLVQ